MAYSPKIKPTSRAEHAGSFLRPPRLLEATGAREAEKITESDMARFQDDCIAEIVAFKDNRG